MTRLLRALRNIWRGDQPHKRQREPLCGSARLDSEHIWWIPEKDYTYSLKEPERPPADCLRCIEVREEIRISRGYI